MARQMEDLQDYCFAGEYEDGWIPRVHVFSSEQERDAWVSETLPKESGEENPRSAIPFDELQDYCSMNNAEGHFEHPAFFAFGEEFAEHFEDAPKDTLIPIFSTDFQDDPEWLQDTYQWQEGEAAQDIGALENYLLERYLDDGSPEAMDERILFREAPMQYVWQLHHAIEPDEAYRLSLQEYSNQAYKDAASDDFFVAAQLKASSFWKSGFYCVHCRNPIYHPFCKKTKFRPSVFRLLYL